MISGMRTVLGAIGLWAPPKQHIEIQLHPNHAVNEQCQAAFTFHDVGECCEAVILENFCLNPLLDVTLLDKRDYQLTFNLKPCEDVELKFYQGHVAADILADKLSVMAKCAAESVLKSLFAVGLIEYSVVTCHALHGSKVLIESFIVGGPSVSVANPGIMMVQVDVDAMQLTMSFNATGFAQNAMAMHLKERYPMIVQQEELRIRIDM